MDSELPVIDRFDAAVVLHNEQSDHGKGTSKTPGADVMRQEAHERPPFSIRGGHQYSWRFV